MANTTPKNSKTPKNPTTPKANTTPTTEQTSQDQTDTVQTDTVQDTTEQDTVQDTVQTEQTTQTDTVQQDSTVQTEQTTETSQDTATMVEQTEQTQDSPKVDLLLLSIAQELSIDLNPDHTNDQVKTFLQSLDILTLGQTVPNPTVKFLEFYGHKDLTSYKLAFALASIDAEFAPENPKQVKDQWLVLDNIKLGKDDLILLMFSWTPDIVYLVNTLPGGLGLPRTYPQFKEFISTAKVAIRLNKSEEDQTLNAITLIDGVNSTLADNLKEKLKTQPDLHAKLVLNPNLFSKVVLEALCVSCADLQGLSGKRKQDYVSKGEALLDARQKLLLPVIKAKGQYRKALKAAMEDF